MIRAQALIATLFLVAFSTAQSDEIILSSGEIQNLGIRFVQPSPTIDGGGIEATAHVTLPPAADALISSSHSGLLTRLAAEVGDEIQAGDVVAELRSPEFINLQRDFLDAANAQQLAQSAYDRDTQLQTEGIISMRRLQETTAHKAVADAAFDQHHQLLKFTGMRDEDIQALSSELLIQELLVVRAPFSGLIADRLASTGERLDSMAPIYRLVNLSELWLEINVPQEQLTNIRTGAKVEIIGSADNWKAVVTTAGRAIDPSTQSAIVRARLEQNTDDLRPGQFVSVRVFTTDPEAALTDIFEVPAAAVIRSDNDSYIFVQTADGFEVIQVEVVSYANSSAFIRGPIVAQDSIAASSLSALKSMWLANADEGL